MKKIVLVLLISVSAFTLKAQEKDPVLLTIGGSDVKISEFNAIFNKNKNNEKITQESINEYLDLYIKFKLKVREAEALGYDTLPKFINELKGYRTQLAQPYLTDKEVTEGLIKEAYERMKQDIRAAHILIEVKEGASPADTLEAYNKVMKLRKRVLAGEDFTKLAKENSSDPSAQKNGGDLGYFSALHMVYPFETAAYTTKIGDVSMPIKTKFGYHILTVSDKRPARGVIKTAHIMVKMDAKESDEDQKAKKQKIDEIYQKLTTEGQDFAALAKQFSDDQGSARKGGELPEFNTGKMVESYENAAYALKNDGDISQPIKTEYGWHIIKRLGLKELESYDDLYNTIKAKVSRDSRSNKSKEALINKIKIENGFVENIKERDDFYKLITKDQYLKGEWTADKAGKNNKLMFAFYAKDGDKVEYTQTDFANYLEKASPKGKTDANMVLEINNIYEGLVEKTAIEFTDSRLSKTNEEFRLLMKEYRDGILLFDLTDEKVWSKAVKDSAGLHGFYEQHKTKYMYDQRVKATLYVCDNADIAAKVQKILKKKAKKGYTNAQILEMINTDSQLALKIEEGKFSKGDNDDVDKATWTKGTQSSIKNDKSVTIVEVEDVLAPTPKELDQIKGLITSDYQNYLETEWVKELKAKYKVTVDKEVLKLVK